MIPAPFHAGRQTVRPEWIDYNGHMNLAYYVLMFDVATDALWDQIGLGTALRDTGFTTFAAETHTLYKAELLVGETAECTCQIVAADAKRLHIAHEMRRTRDGVVAAQQELMLLCVNMATRRVAPFPAPAADGVRQAAKAHAGLPRPDWVGRVVAMPSPA